MCLHFFPEGQSQTQPRDVRGENAVFVLFSPRNTGQCGLEKDPIGGLERIVRLCTKCSCRTYDNPPCGLREINVPPVRGAHMTRLVDLVSLHSRGARGSRGQHGNCGSLKLS